MQNTRSDLTRMSVRFPPSLYRRLREASRETATPMAVLIRMALAMQLSSVIPTARDLNNARTNN